MTDTALNHLPLVIAFITLLIAHMFRLDELVFGTIGRRARLARQASRVRRKFARCEANGDVVVVDPDGRITRRRGR